MRRKLQGCGLSGSVLLPRDSPAFIGSIPGLKVDSTCHVLNSAGEAVENLYAAGMVMFGNVFNVAYPSSGTGVGVSHYTGAIAARDAVAAIA